MVSPIFVELDIGPIRADFVPIYVDLLLVFSNICHRRILPKSGDRSVNRGIMSGTAMRFGDAPICWRSRLVLGHWRLLLPRLRDRCRPRLGSRRRHSGRAIVRRRACFDGRRWSALGYCRRRRLRVWLGRRFRRFGRGSLLRWSLLLDRFFGQRRIARFALAPKLPWVCLGTNSAFAPSKIESARGDFHVRFARSRVLREEPVYDGGASPAASLLFFGPRAKKDSADGCAPHTPRGRGNCKQVRWIARILCHQFTGRPSTPADKKGGLGGEATVAVWPQASRRSGSGVPQHKQNSSRSALVSARSERSIQGVRSQFTLPPIQRTCPQSFACNSTDLPPNPLRSIQGVRSQFTLLPIQRTCPQSFACNSTDPPAIPLRPIQRTCPQFPSLMPYRPRASP